MEITRKQYNLLLKTINKTLYHLKEVKEVLIEMGKTEIKKLGAT